MDIAHQQRVMTALRSEAGAGHTVITVVHDLNLAAGFADRMVLLSQGRSVADGPPADVLVEDLLSEVYMHPVRVVDHPLREAPLVVPLDETV